MIGQAGDRRRSSDCVNGVQASRPIEESQNPQQIQLRPFAKQLLMGFHQSQRRLVLDVQLMTSPHVTQVYELQKAAEQFQHQRMPVVLANGGLDLFFGAAHAAGL
jgi:hypothetical protein